METNQCGLSIKQICENKDHSIVRNKFTLKALQKLDNVKKIVSLDMSKSSMRNHAVEGLIEIANLYSVNEDVLLLAMAIFDHVVPKIDDSLVKITIATSILVALKMEGIQFASLCENMAAHLGGMTSEDIVKNEIVVFKDLGFDSLFVTALSFIRYYLTKQTDCECFIVPTEFCVLAGVTDYQCRHFTEDQIAGSALSLVSEVLEMPIDIPEVAISNECKQMIQKRISILVSREDSPIMQRCASVKEQLAPFLAKMNQSQS